MTAGEVITRFVADITGFSSGISRMVSQVSSFESTIAGHVSRVGSGFLNMGKSIVGGIEGMGRFIFFGKQIVSTGASLVQGFLAQNASMEQTRIAFVGLLGSGQAADTMLRNLQTFAASTPFEFPELAKDTQMLVGMGFSAQQVIPILTAVGDAAAGVGAGSEGVESITRALGQMQAKGKITGEEMMQLTEVGIPAWKILADSMHLTVAQVQDMASKGQLSTDAINMLWQGMERVYGGQMAGQAQTFNGLLSTLHDNAIQGLMAFAGPIFEMAKGGLQQLTTLAGSPAFADFARTVGTMVGGALSTLVGWVQQAITWFGGFSGQISGLGSAMSGLGAQIGPLVQGFANWLNESGILTSMLDGVRAAISGVITAITTIVGWITQFIAWLRQGSDAALMVRDALSGLGIAIAGVAIGALVAGFVSLAIAAGSAAVAVIAATWPILAIAAAVAALAAGFLYFYRTNEPFRAFIDSLVIGFQQLWSLLVANLQPAIERIGSFMAANFVPVWQQLVNVWNTSLMPSLRQLWEAFQPLVPIITMIAELIGGLLLAAIGVIVGAIGGLIKGLAGFLSGMTTVFAGVVQIITGAVQVISGLVTFIVDLFTGNFSKLSTDLGRIWQGIINIFGGAWTVIVGLFQTAWNTISGIVTGFVDGIIGFFTFLKDAIVGHSIIPDMLNMMMSLWNATIGTVINVTVSFISSLIANFTNLGASMASIWTNIRTVATDTWNTIWTNITTFVGNIYTSVTSKITDMQNFLSSAWNAIQTGVTNAWNGIVNAIRGATNSMIDVLNGGINGINNFVNGIADGINSVAKTLGLGTLVSHISIGLVPHLASGTDYWQGGVAMVGEEGPELAYLPRGTQVLNARDTSHVVQNGVTTHIPGLAEGTGDMLSTLFNWLVSGVSSIASNFMKQFDIGSFTLPGVFGDIASSLVGKITGGLGDYINSLFGKSTTMMGQVPFTGSLPMAWRGQFLLPPGGGFHQMYWYGIHNGMDMQYPQGSVLREIIGGMVLPSTGWKPWGGEVDVRIPNGLWERYEHMSQIAVHAGQILRRGDYLGLSGGGTVASGLGYWSNGAHLHIQYDTGAYNRGIDPLNVWAAYGLFSPFSFARGGVINEPVVGMGLNSGHGYTFGENGPETIIPGRGAARGTVINLVIDGRTLADALGDYLGNQARIEIGGVA